MMQRWDSMIHTYNCSIWLCIEVILGQLQKQLLQVRCSWNFSTAIPSNDCEQLVCCFVGELLHSVHFSKSDCSH